MEDCPICLIEFNEDDHLFTCRRCSNKYHTQCMSRWLRNYVSRNRCPTCRLFICTHELNERRNEITDRTLTDEQRRRNDDEIRPFVHSTLWNEGNNNIAHFESFSFSNFGFTTNYVSVESNYTRPVMNLEDGLEQFLQEREEEDNRLNQTVSDVQEEEDIIPEPEPEQQNEEILNSPIFNAPHQPIHNNFSFLNST